MKVREAERKRLLLLSVKGRLSLGGTRQNVSPRVISVWVAAVDTEKGECSGMSQRDLSYLEEASCKHEEENSGHYEICKGRIWWSVAVLGDLTRSYSIREKIGLKSHRCRTGEED